MAPLPWMRCHLIRKAILSQQRTETASHSKRNWGGSGSAGSGNSSFMQHIILFPQTRLLVIIALLVSVYQRALSIPILLPNDGGNAVLFQLQALNDTADKSVKIGVSGSGNINFRSLWTYDDKEAPTIFSHPNAFADISDAEWAQVQYSRWSIEVGNGHSEAYKGNRDAGQLWLDLHSNNAVKRPLTPELTMAKLDLSWLGIGYRLPFSFQRMHVEWRISARYLQINHFELGSAVGDVNGEDFTGMVKVMNADGAGCGTGWTTDTSLFLNTAGRWQAALAINDLAGEMTIHQGRVTDVYLVSPRIYEDPEGFLHDFWGASGSTWRENHDTVIDPSFTFSLIRKGHPTTALVLQHDSTRTTPTLACLWQLPHHWQAVVGLSSTTRQLLVGALHPYGTVYLTCDDFPGRKPNRLSLYLQLRPLTF